MPATRTNHYHAQRLARTGWWIVLGAIVPFGLWIGLAPLSMAVVAPAVVTVDLHRRPVQHLEGGIVRAVLVRDGQRVNAGDPVLMLGDVGVQADLNRLGYRVNVERAALARLESEQALAKTLVFSHRPGHRGGRKDERIEPALTKETALFSARRDSLTSEVALMKAQRERVEQEISALRAHRSRKGKSHLRFARGKDLEVNQLLLKDKFIAPVLVWQKEAAVLDYAAKLDERRSELARAEQRLLDGELKIKSIFRMNTSESQAISSRRRAAPGRRSSKSSANRKTPPRAKSSRPPRVARSSISRLRRRAPWYAPGEPIAEIVPSNVRLMIEARIRPEEVNSVHLGQRAEVKFSAFKYRKNSMVTGEVTYVSADRLIDSGSKWGAVLQRDDPGQRRVTPKPRVT